MRFAWARDRAQRGLPSPLHLTMPSLRLRTLTLQASLDSLEHTLEERSPLWFRAPHLVRGPCPLVYCAIASFCVFFRVRSRRHDLLSGCFCGHCAVPFSPAVASGCIPRFLSRLLLHCCCVRWCGPCLRSLRLRFLHWFGGCDFCMSGTATWHHLEQHSSLVPCATQTCSANLPLVHLSGVVY